MYAISIRILWIVVVNQALNNLSGFYLRSVLFHISQFNALFRSLISVILVKFIFFCFIASYFPQLMFLAQFNHYVHKMLRSFFFAIKHTVSESEVILEILLLLITFHS